MQIGSYPKVYTLGHKAIESLFDNKVVVEEKVDGSQFSFMKKKGRLYCRSKEVQLDPFSTIGMFEKAVNIVKELEPLMHEGWTYRSEYLQTPKHNTLEYSRVPNKHLIVYDIDKGLEDYISYEEKKDEANKIGLECVPLIYFGLISGPEDIMDLMQTESILGGTTIEGMVFKNYKRFTSDGKVCMGKYVSTVFKEQNKEKWKKDKPTKKDVIQRVVEVFRTDARWNKSVQHLKEAGLLTNSPKDISDLMKEVIKDTEIECIDEIKDMLYEWASPEIKRGIVMGFAEWYKKKLMEDQFK